MAAISLQNSHVQTSGKSAVVYDLVDQSPGLTRILEHSPQRQLHLLSAWEFSPNIDDLIENETVGKIKKFMDLDKIQASKSPVRQLIEGLLKWLGYDITAEGLFLKRMQKELESGCCHGISMALMGALDAAEKTNHPINFDDVISNLDKQDIITLQVLTNLRSEVYTLTKSRRKELTDSIISRRGQLPDATEKALHEKVQEGQELIKAINNAIIEISRFDFTEVKTANTDVNINGYLKDAANTNAKFVISLCTQKNNISHENPEDLIPGHSIVVDLKNFVYFDINGDHYKFASKEECIKAVKTRIEFLYPEYVGGTWIMRTVRPEPIASPFSVSAAAKHGLISNLVTAACGFAAASSGRASQSDDDSGSSTSSTAADGNKKTKGRFHLPNPFKKKKKAAEGLESDSE